MTAIEFRKLIDDEGKLGAAKLVNPGIKTVEEAELVIFDYIQRLLAHGKYLAAGIVLWGPVIFDVRPSPVRRVFDHIGGNALTLLQGGGGLGKTYNAGAWILMDWWRDPQYTLVKLISTTEGHAKSGIFSHLCILHSAAIVKMPGNPVAGYIGLDPLNKKSGIEVVAIPAGDDGKGRLQGFHPVPRSEAHPVFGFSSRIRAMIDEAEKVPAGLWEGIDNLCVSLNGTEVIKIIGAYNPADQSSKTAQNAEPKNGWESFDVEKGVEGKDEWVSRRGWSVLRLDGAKFENVKERKLIFPNGYMTFEGFMKLRNKNDGNSPEYFTFGRGAYPPNGTFNIIFPTNLFNRIKGEFTFLAATVRAFGADIAIEGRDDAIGCSGRFGIAVAFTHANGTVTRFDKARQCLQIDQFFELLKGDTKIVGDAIRQQCSALNVSPEYCGHDSTGNGKAVLSYLRAIWSNDVHGVDFNKASSALKILEEDIETPEELYDGLVTEVWFAMAKWAEFGILAISPAINDERLSAEVTTRRYLMSPLAGKKLKVEKKDDYKARMGNSPDYADTLSIIVDTVRKRSGMMGVMVENKAERVSIQRDVEHGAVDTIDFVDFGTN